MNQPNKLYYANTSNEIRLGDRISYKSLMFGKIQGVVFYIPDESPLHPEMEYEDVKNWAIKLDNGRILSWIYLPGELKVSKKINFVRRAEDNFKGLQPDENLL